MTVVIGEKLGVLQLVRSLGKERIVEFYSTSVPFFTFSLPKLIWNFGCHL
jgi:hypothetical protein